MDISCALPEHSELRLQDGVPAPLLHTAGASGGSSDAESPSERPSAAALAALEAARMLSPAQQAAQDARREARASQGGGKPPTTPKRALARDPSL